MPRKKASSHGGARAGAGRKPKVEGDPVKPVTVSLHESTLARLDALDGTRSENVDRLVNHALDALAKPDRRKASR